MPAPFDKYAAYVKSVQSPHEEACFLRDIYTELRGENPAILREDYCGTFSLCCEWVKLGRDFEALGIDIDPEPLSYGIQRHLSKLAPHQKRRVSPIKNNVLSPNLPAADIICALNFSHFHHMTSSDMGAYFARCRRALLKGGILITDCFGGGRYQATHRERKKLPSFTYYWDQKSMDPVTNRARFEIHFKPKNGPMKRNVFSYDWRMWSIPEIREVMHESGYRKTHVYWEGTGRDGTGNGFYEKKEHGEECDCWIAYVVGEK